MPKPTYEELADLVVALRAHIVGQDAHIARQEARIAELERQVGATSRNSSKLPSSDGLGKPDPKSLRGRSGRGPGGQGGHLGKTLEQVAEPDEVIRHEPARCGGCGARLARAPEVGLARRQVFDLPPIAIRVTEHELVSRLCPCGARTTTEDPDGVNAPVQYGPRVKAIMVYLYMGQYLSKHRTAKAMSELFGTPVSDGTVSAATARAAEDLDGFSAVVSKKIAAAAVAHFDETGFRADGKLHWLHSASTTMFTAITCHARRGREAMNAAGILPDFTGIAVHDAWAPYDTYPQITTRNQRALPQSLTRDNLDDLQADLAAEITYRRHLVPVRPPRSYFRSQKRPGGRFPTKKPADRPAKRPRTKVILWTLPQRT